MCVCRLGSYVCVGTLFSLALTTSLPFFWFPFVFSFCLLYSRLPFSSFTFFVSLLLLFAFVCFLTSGAFTFFSVSFSGVLSYLPSLYVFYFACPFVFFCLVFVYLLGLGFVVHPVCVCVHLSGFFFFFLIRRVILFFNRRWSSVGAFY